MRYAKSPSRSKKSATDTPPADAAPWEPTPERQGKEPYGFEMVQKPGGVASHQVRTAFDEHAGQFTPQEIRIAEDLVNDSDDATRVNIICGRTYTGMPYTGSGQKAGHITHTQREAHARFVWIMRHVDERFRAVLAALVLGIRAERTGKAYSLEEMGKQATRWLDGPTRKGVGLGLLKGALWRAGEAYKEWHMLERRRKENIEQLRRQREHDAADGRLAQADDGDFR